MAKRYKWLPYAIVATGIVLVLLLVFAINSDPVVRWFQFGAKEASQARGLERAEARSMTWQDVLGTVLFSIFILALVLSHLVLLIVAANLLNKPRMPAVPHRPAACPQCERDIQSDWRVCPYCGFTLGKPSDDSLRRRR
jgi:hypothetical protein